MTPADLRTLRQRLGWSQQQLAEALGVHRVTVANWERGLYPIDERTALAVRALERETK